eukprot:scaffold49640_cov87-Phaeocystis_antarctica.AAC.1
MVNHLLGDNSLKKSMLKGSNLEKISQPQWKSLRKHILALSYPRRQGNKHDIESHTLARPSRKGTLWLGLGLASAERLDTAGPCKPSRKGSLWVGSASSERAHTACQLEVSRWPSSNTAHLQDVAIAMTAFCKMNLTRHIGGWGGHTENWGQVNATRDY